MTRSLGPSAQGRLAFDEVFRLSYEELRLLAATVLRTRPDVTLDPTSLVDEAWIKLARSPALAELPHSDFMRVAARAMRQVLIESARRQHAGKRSNDSISVSFDEALYPTRVRSKKLLALDEALHQLARTHPRQAAIVEHLFFGGFNVAETAALLGVSEITAQRDWRAARSWLARKLGRLTANRASTHLNNTRGVST